MWFLLSRVAFHNECFICFVLYSSYDVTFGFACINEKQRSKQCEDYQVILTCPSDFCQGKFSCRWDSFCFNVFRDFIF